MVGLPTLRMSKGRDLVTDDGKLLIPRDTTIWIPLGLPHMSSAIFDHPDQFLPERWLEPNAEYMPYDGAAASFACSHCVGMGQDCKPEHAGCCSIIDDATHC